MGFKFGVSIGTTACFEREALSGVLSYTPQYPAPCSAQSQQVGEGFYKVAKCYLALEEAVC